MDNFYEVNDTNTTSDFEGKAKKIMKGLFLASIFMCALGLIKGRINDTAIYTDGTVHIEEDSQYVTIDNQFSPTTGSYKLPYKYENQFQDGSKVTCKILTLPTPPIETHILSEVTSEGK